MSKQKTEIQRARDQQLAQWLRLGLAKSGVEKQALAQELGLHPSAISHMLRGVREFKEAEVLIISQMIKEPPPPLLPEGTQNGTKVEHVRSVGWAHPTVIIAPGVWREAGAPVMLSERAPLSPNPKIAGADQYVCKIEGVDKYAVCVDFATFRTAPRLGDKVHIVRTNGGLEEHTLHQVTRLDHGRAYISPLEHPGPEAPLDAGQALRGLIVGFFGAEPVDI